MADEEQKTEESSKGGGGRLFLMLAIALVSLGLGGGGVWFVLGQQDEPELEEEAEAVEVEEASLAERMVTLDPFVVNVNGDGFKRYLKTQIEVELASAEAREETVMRSSQVRDSLILLLTSKRLSDLGGFEGKAVLKQEISDRVEAVVGDDTVRSVLLTEFVIQ